MRYLLVILIAIAVVGALALPLGDPRFFYVGLALESSYITLAVLTFKYVRIHTIIACIILASLVIIANTLSIQHVKIMMSLSPLYNAIILILGGYVLQSLLIISSIHTYNSIKVKKYNME